MARHIVRSTSKIKTTTIKTTTSSTTTNKPATSTNTSTISTNAYNELLSKFNNYALKSSLTDFITQQELNSAISTIKQCNCEQQTIGSGSVDNNALNALIQKLNNYGIFNYDVPGKETIVTEFFPNCNKANSNITNNEYGDSHTGFCISDTIEVALLIAREAENNSSLNIFDFIEIGNQTINESSYKNYFSIAANKEIIISKNILNEQISFFESGNTYKTINLWFNGTALNNYLGSDPTIGSGQILAKFYKEINIINNEIICNFDGIYYRDDEYIYGTITLTMPENIILYNFTPSNKNLTAIVNNNIITITADPEYGLKKQIIIADSATKRYVIKLNGEAYAPPPNY